MAERTTTNGRGATLERKPEKGISSKASEEFFFVFLVNEILCWTLVRVAYANFYCHVGFKLNEKYWIKVSDSRTGAPSDF